jgi:UDP-N-acetylmuramoyl-L-alanyl-D-glutamate--2,6-diaminopimelate ligase
MAEIVARLSDFVILTSDNPRDEDELQIIQDAMRASRNTPIRRIR